MLTKRIIACLDVDAGRVVKGVHFADLRDAGDPAELAPAYSRSGADEIILLDISAANQKRSTLLEIVRKSAQHLFVPFTVGGGIRSLDEEFLHAIGRAHDVFQRVFAEDDGAGQTTQIG